MEQCTAKSFSAVCLYVCIVSRVLFFFGQEFVAVLFPFPLQSGAGQEGWLVGWLHRKGNGLRRSADGGQHVPTLQKCTPSPILCTYVFKIVTQLDHCEGYGG